MLQNMRDDTMLMEVKISLVFATESASVPVMFL